MGPLALNHLASSLSGHHYSHQCNHHPAGAPVCVLCMIYFKSCNSLAQKVSPIGTICPSSQCLPCFLLYLRVAILSCICNHIEQNLTACLCFAYITFFVWCLPCTLQSVDFLLDSIQTQLRLWVHMTVYKPAFNIHDQVPALHKRICYFDKTWCISHQNCNS